MNQVLIRKATLADLGGIKSLADAHKLELGFVLRPALASSIERSELLVAENSRGIVGFVEYHHRQDEQTTLYHVAVDVQHRHQCIGRELMETLIEEALEYKKSFIQLKCPADLDANRFYERLDFLQVGVEPGKRRELVVWHFLLNSSACGAGK